MKLKGYLLLSLLITFSTLAEEPKSISYWDCSLLAELMLDLDREEEFIQKAVKQFKKENQDKSGSDLMGLYTAQVYFRKGYFEGSINALSYQLKINKGTAAGMLNEQNYCEHYKW